MNCPFCNQEMIKGKAVNSTIHAVDFVFKRDDEKFKLKDIVPHENRIYTRVISGETLEAYYCVKCKKIIMVSDAN